jgi:hypothetical protein
MTSRLSYTVAVSDFVDGAAGRADRPVALIENLSLTRAWRIVRRHARRGLKLYGGDALCFDNWGARGGCELRSYRSAFIRVTTDAERRALRRRRHG